MFKYSYIFVLQLINKTKQIYQMQAIKQPRSVDVPAEILDWLKSHRSQFKTEVAFALSIGVDRLVANRILLVGSCSPRSLKVITKSFNKHKQKVAA